MSRLSDWALYKYEPRLLSRSMTILKPSSKTCCWIVSRTFDGAVVLGFSLFVVLRDEVASASTDGILIVDRNLSRERGQWSTGILPGKLTFESAGETPADPTARMAALHNPAAQEFVFSSQQLLHEIVAALIRVARRAGKVLIDSHPC